MERRIATATATGYSWPYMIKQQQRNDDSEEATTTATTTMTLATSL